MIKTACGNLVNKTYQSKKITSAKLKIQPVLSDIHYTCELSTDIPNDVDMCTGLPEAACKKNCTWDGTQCVQKKITR